MTAPAQSPLLRSLDTPTAPADPTQPAGQVIPLHDLGLGADNVARETDADPNSTVVDWKHPDVQKTVVRILQGYIAESRDDRLAGLSSRDQIWRENAQLYWMRKDFSHKEAWQSKQQMPDVPNYTDRFSATIGRLLRAAGDWYSVEDLIDENNTIEDTVKKGLRVQFAQCSRNRTGQPVDFTAVFPQVIKHGCIKACAVSVTAGEDGNVRIDPVDAYEIFLDPTGRQLYRRRRKQMERHQLDDLKALKDSNGNPLYDHAAIDSVQTWIDPLIEMEKRIDTGTGQDVQQTRKPCVVDEFLCTLVDINGKKLGSNMLVVLANEQTIIRGPEPNPYAHGKDWIVYCPLIEVPFAPYGKSYIETFASLCEMFDEYINLIFDGTFVQLMNVKVILAHLLKDPSVVQNGITPGLTLIAAEETTPDEVKGILQSVPMGEMRPEIFQVLQTLELKKREGASQNELSLGQLPTAASTTATAVTSAGQEASSFADDIASNVEQNLLDPIVELTWMTFLQHANPADPKFVRAYGADFALMITKQRDDLMKHQLRFKARGISSQILKAKQLRQLLAILQVIASNPVLTQQFMEEYDVGALVDLMLQLGEVDVTRLKRKPGTMGAPGGPPPGAPPGAPPVGGVGAPGGQGQGPVAPIATDGGASLGQPPVNPGVS